MGCQDGGGASGYLVPRTRLPGVRSASSHARQTAQAIPARATIGR